MNEYLRQDLHRLANYIRENGFGGSTFLITGATGLIGSLCVKSIISYNKRNEDKIKLYALARDEGKAQKTFENEFCDKSVDSNIHFIYGDIVNPIVEEFHCDYIIHTANSTTSKFFISNPVEVLDSIYLGTRNILEFGKMSGVKGIVYLSSMEVFGQIFEEKRIAENELGTIDLQKVRSCYPEGKRIAELMCKLYSNQFSVPVKVARLAQTFGAGVSKQENRVFAQFLRNAIAGENIVLHTEGHSMGNYCYTADVLEAIFLLLHKGENGAVYTVVNEETTRTIRKMAELVADNFSGGRSKVVVDIPQNESFGYAVDTKMRLSSQKLRQLGWNPTVHLCEMYERMLPDLSV